MKILITGIAGFIGMSVAIKLLQQNAENDNFYIVGIDNLNDYYDVNLKLDRLKNIQQQLGDKSKNKSKNKSEKFIFIKGDISDNLFMQNLFNEHTFDAVINLAAQAGVRYSLQDPNAYIQSNIVGFTNILEGCRKQIKNIKHLVYASSSSVYGGNTKMPFSEHDNVDHPVSLYAATKKSNELMAHTYSHLFGLPTTGLRFFTVYGEWGRPDMALFLFTKAIINDEEIKVFNNGNMQRDFTYIDDIVLGIIGVLNNPPNVDSNDIKIFDANNPDPAISKAPYRILNIGNSHPVQLMEYIKAIENCLHKTAKKQFLPLQMGDVANTYADTTLLNNLTGFKPNTPVSVGVEKFIKWYRNYYAV